MQVFRLKDNYRHSDYLHRNNTKELFHFFRGDTTIFTDTEDRTEQELAEMVQSGKVALFPIWEKQKMDTVRGHINHGFTVYFMRYKDFNVFHDWYVENYVEVKNKREETQLELPL